MVIRAGRFWRTIRHLRLGQVLGRVVHLLVRPRPDASPAPRVRDPVSGAWVVPIAGNESLLGPSTHQFLGEARDLTIDGWDAGTASKLWRYNLHYFADLTASGAADREEWHRRLLLRWVNENPPGCGTGWESYPTSRRIVNWVKWALAGNELPAVCIQSLAVQTRWLARRLERHLLGNHLLANGKALLFAGTFFDGAEAQVWRQLGARIIEAEVQEQVLPDGGHFERSPMYHALVLEDVLDLLNLAGAYADRATMGDVPALLASRIGAMRHWLAAMSHPDGGISFFNDAAFGVAPSAEDLEAYACRLRLPPAPAVRAGALWLSSSGYARLSNAAVVALCDVAELGPDYLPGHAHADSLSFELSINGRRVFVNSGTSRYDVCDERLRQRGTAAHNTVTIDARDSSEVWSSFRVGRRARPHVIECGEGGGVATLRGSHDGYRHLRGSPEHERRWTLSADRLIVTDLISGPGHEAIARFLLHPQVSPVRREPESASVSLQYDGRILAEISVDGGELTLERASWHFEFGSSIPTSCIVVRIDGPRLVTTVSWGTRA